MHLQRKGFSDESLPSHRIIREKARLCTNPRLGCPRWAKTTILYNHSCLWSHGTTRLRPKHPPSVWLVHKALEQTEPPNSDGRRFLKLSFCTVTNAHYQTFLFKKQFFFLSKPNVLLFSHVCWTCDSCIRGKWWIEDASPANSAPRQAWLNASTRSHHPPLVSSKTIHII